MAPPPSSWWGSDDQRGTPVVVKMDNPYSLVEIDGPGMAHQSEKARGKNAKQFTWVLLLRAHRAVGCLAWLATGFWGVLGIVNRRVRRSRDADAEPDAEASGRGRVMLGFLRAFLLLSLGMLAFETVAYLKGWHFPQHLPGNLQELEDQLQQLPEHLRHLPEQLRRLPERREIEGWVHAAYVAWLDFRVEYIAWAIHKLSAFCIVLFMVQSVDRIVLCLGCFWIKVRGIKPRAEVSSSSGNKSSSRSVVYVEGGEDDEDPDGYYPMVLVQMPMCNEKEVSQSRSVHL
jgi:xyloglucan glycosyltransferase 4